MYGLYMMKQKCTNTHNVESNVNTHKQYIFKVYVAMPFYLFCQIAPEHVKMDIGIPAYK